MRPKRYLTQLAVATAVAAGFVLALQGVVLAAVVSYSPGTTGNDISYPNCGASFPAGSTFGIVGVTGGRAFSKNSCLGSEFTTASGISDATALPALYMNLNAPVGPTARQGLTGPAGSCSRKDKACIAYNYGYNAAEAAHNYAQTASASSGSWWLDIETANSWSAQPSLNQDTISGAVYFFYSESLAIGFYSTPSQWAAITGSSTWSPSYPPPSSPTSTSTPTSTPYPVWEAGASQSNPEAICKGGGFAGASPELVQYWSSTTNLDTDYAC